MRMFFACTRTTTIAPMVPAPEVADQSGKQGAKPEPVAVSAGGLARDGSIFRIAGAVSAIPRRRARHAFVRVALSALALLIVPEPSRARNKDIPSGGITTAIPTGWTLLPPDPSRPGKQLVAPD